MSEKQKKSKEKTSSDEDLDALLLDGDEDIEGIDDISDEELLNEPLDDDLDDEIGTLLGVKPKPKIEISTTVEKGTNKQTRAPNMTTQNKPNLQAETKAKRADNTSNPPNANVAILKQFTIFLKEKSKYYEEISFDTIIRKIPKAWNFISEEIIIDIIEKLLEHGLIAGKMTVNSFKYQNIDKIKEK